MALKRYVRPFKDEERMLKLGSGVLTKNADVTPRYRLACGRSSDTVAYICFIPLISCVFFQFLFLKPSLRDRQEKSAFKRELFAVLANRRILMHALRIEGRVMLANTYHIRKNVTPYFTGSTGIASTLLDKEKQRWVA